MVQKWSEICQRLFIIRSKLKKVCQGCGEDVEKLVKNESENGGHGSQFLNSTHPI